MIEREREREREREKRDVHHGETDHENRPPFIPIQWDHSEQTLKEGYVEKSKVKYHGKDDGVNKYHVLPEWKRHE